MGMTPEKIPIEVLYEDEHLLVVNKPAGMVVHPTYRNASGTVMNGLLERALDWPAWQRPSLVNRLDKATSGLLVVAKSADLHAQLQRVFSSDETEKDYLAVVYGAVDEAHGEIDLRLSHDPDDRRRIVASRIDGAESLTRFVRLASVPAPGVGLSLLRCRLLTGRTHQIRVHLTSRGWGLVGDPMYGEPRWTGIADPELAAVLRTFPRQALHASRTAFTHPATAARIVVDAPLPDDISQLLDAAGLGQPCV